MVSLTILSSQPTFDLLTKEERRVVYGIWGKRDVYTAQRCAGGDGGHGSWSYTVGVCAWLILSPGAFPDLRPLFSDTDELWNFNHV